VALTSYPGERAKLAGGMVEIAPGADYVTLSNLGIDGAKVADDTVWIQASHATVQRSDITNENSGKSCMIIGSVGSDWGGPTARVTIRGNRFHRCGNPADGNQDHALYIENTSDSLITGNVIWGTSAYAIHLYPNAQNTRVTHNVIAHNGRGVIFAGDASHASSNNTVAYNVIADTSLDPNIRSYWGGPVGTGNMAHHNCLYNGNPHDVGTQTGFTASNNVHANPRFVNPAKHDYRLSARSRCLTVVGFDTAARLARTTTAAVTRRHHGSRRVKHHRSS
jgi:hypothetical protein